MAAKYDGTLTYSEAVVINSRAMVALPNRVSIAWIAL
jgi:hypothetical protein